MSLALYENVNTTSFPRHCLLKYITQPFDKAAEYHWHQNLWQVPLLAEELGNFGYNVDVINWNDDNVTLNKQYDLVIDISPHNRQIYQKHLSPACRHILFATGSAPAWQRLQESNRLEDLYRRRGIRLEPKTPPAYDYPSPHCFDGFFLFGNRHTLTTFGPVNTDKVAFITNTGYLLPPPTDFSQKSPRNFLFLASRNQILKGLDLLLEVFSANHDITLYICSLFAQEPEFCQVYAKELFQHPNIKPIGFLDLYGSHFQELVQKCAYVIAPSCSEGISGSVLSAMSAGLIPLISRECGLEKCDAHIFDNCSINTIAETVADFSCKDPNWIRAETFRALDTIHRRYSPCAYLLSIRAALEKLLGPPSSQDHLVLSHSMKKRSAFMIATTRVGIPLTGGKYWHGGVSYIETLVKSVTALPKSERPELYLVISDHTLPHFECYQPFLSHFDGIIMLSPNPPAGDLVDKLGKAPVWCHNFNELFAIIDFYYPVNSDVLPYPQAASWIPDFQHKALPEFFSEYEHNSREDQFQKVAAEAQLVIFNSHDAEADFKKYYPASKAVTKILPAAIYPEEDWYTADPSAIQAKYNLPPRFVLCSNQFWIHKNHLTLFRAAALIKSAGQAIHIVCTGPTDDYRAPAYFTYLQNEITRMKLDDSITVLGLIPRSDQLQLLRRCMFVVQPSLFEGLSLIVQECRAFGKPLLLSDLDIHKEYQYGTLFNRLSPEDLAARMVNLLSDCCPGPDTAAEITAKNCAMELVHTCGRQFSSIILDHLCSIKPPPSPKPAHPPVAIVTSLSLDNITNEQLAIKSWQQAGFKVIAMNTADDIARLSPLFPDIEFIPASRDASARYGKPYIYFRDLVDCCVNLPSAISGIAKADIILPPELMPFVAQEGQGSIIFGSRLDTDSADLATGDEHSGGFDYIFFDKSVANYYPRESFCLGLYWWDYWAVLMPIAAGVTAKRLELPIAKHVRHQTSPNLELWRKLGLELARYAETDYAVTPDTLANYQKLLFQTIKDNSTAVSLPSS
ncbi:MAG: glycosyl transferase group 1 [Firmicutes bacterium]|nr:glycosyl transferase group 1 [Bacillota bacterium]